MRMMKTAAEMECRRDVDDSLGDLATDLNSTSLSMTWRAGFLR